MYIYQPLEWFHQTPGMDIDHFRGPWLTPIFPFQDRITNLAKQSDSGHAFFLQRHSHRLQKTAISSLQYFFVFYKVYLNSF